MARLAGLTDVPEGGLRRLDISRCGGFSQRLAGGAQVGELLAALEERQDRIQRLRDMMERSDVTAAEKFRQVIEAYQIENEYGRTIEAYKGSVDINGNLQEVDFLRVGRVSLTYQSVGGGNTGGWDPASRSFVELPPAQYKNQVADGLKVARKQVAPDLMTVPVPAPTSGGQ